MQFNGTQAYMVGDQVVVMQKDLPVKIMQFTGGHLVDSNDADPVLINRALSHAVWSSLAYEKSLYRLPHQKQKT